MKIKLSEDLKEQDYSIKVKNECIHLYQKDFYIELTSIDKVVFSIKTDGFHCFNIMDFFYVTLLNSETLYVSMEKPKFSKYQLMNKWN